MAVGQTRRSGLLRCRECRCADMNVRSDGLDSHMVVRGRASALGLRSPASLDATAYSTHDHESSGHPGHQISISLFVCGVRVGGRTNEWHVNTDISHLHNSLYIHCHAWGRAHGPEMAWGRVGPRRSGAVRAHAQAAPLSVIPPPSAQCPRHPLHRGVSLDEALALLCTKPLTRLPDKLPWQLLQPLDRPGEIIAIAITEWWLPLKLWRRSNGPLAAAVDWAGDDWLLLRIRLDDTQDSRRPHLLCRQDRDLGEAVTRRHGHLRVGVHRD